MTPTIWVSTGCSQRSSIESKSSSTTAQTGSCWRNASPSGAADVGARPERADRELLRAYHERGDLGARERLIEDYLPLAKSLARRYAGRGEQLEDLVQIATVGLIKSVD